MLQEKKMKDKNKECKTKMGGLKKYKKEKIRKKDIIKRKKKDKRE